MSNIGYKRVSTLAQTTERQLHGVELDKVFEDKTSGKSTDRPQLKAMLNYIREGDVLHVHSLDRLCRSTIDTLQLVQELNAKGITVHFHKEGLIAGTDDSAMSRMMLTIFAAVAQAERETMLERQREAAAINPMKRGYGKAIDREGITEALKAGGSIAKVAAQFNVGKSTVQRIKAMCD